MKRVFYYALGGGLGHVTRSLAVIHTLRLEGLVRMAVSTPLVGMIETPEKIELVSPPASLDPSNRSAVAKWIAATAAEFAPDEWFVDCFPAGLLGELPTGSNTPRTLVTRRVEWGEYLRRSPAIENWPRYSRVYATEALDRVQARDLSVIGPPPIDLELIDACPRKALLELDRLADGLGPGAVLVVHSGPVNEVEQILARAQADGDPHRRVLLVTPRRSCPRHLPANVTHRALYPVWPLFARFERIYTAAGANSMRQLAPFRSRHVAVPLRRRLDDQGRRSAALVAAQVANDECLEEIRS